MTPHVQNQGILQSETIAEGRIWQPQTIEHWFLMFHKWNTDYPHLPAVIGVGNEAVIKHNVTWSCQFTTAVPVVAVRWVPQCSWWCNQYLHIHIQLCPVTQELSFGRFRRKAFSAASLPLWYIIPLRWNWPQPYWPARGPSKFVFVIRLGDPMETWSPLKGWYKLIAFFPAFC